MRWAQELERAAKEEESQVRALRAWNEEQSVFLQEKISAIHVDPEALIQEGKWWVRAFSNALLPADPPNAPAREARERAGVWGAVMEEEWVVR